MCLALGACSRAPDSYPPPVQFVMPSGPEPAAALPGPNRPLLAMADADWKSHVLEGVLDGPDGESFRWCRPVARFRVTPNDVHVLQFYMRFIVVDDALRQTGAVTIAISINGHTLDRPRITTGGEQEYVHDVPQGWLVAREPVTIALDAQPGLVVSPTERLGVLLNSIGFRK